VSEVLPASQQNHVSESFTHHAPTLGEPRMTTFRFCAVDGAILYVGEVVPKSVGGGSDVEDGDGK
jgi:hypothetical protein